jgi:excisionase family DNA binding protein
MSVPSLKPITWHALALHSSLQCHSLEENDMNDSQQFLRPSQVAPLLGVTTGRVYQLIGAGLIPAVRIRGSIRIPRAAWESWLESMDKEALSSLRVEPQAGDR